MKTTLLLFAFILTGCSASRITSVWKNENVSPQKYDPIMVVGIMKDEDSSLCRKMEQYFADDLKKLGYNAISSIATYGPHEFKNLAEEETFKLIYKRKVEAVITIELLAKEKVKYEQPLWMQRDPLWSYPLPLQERDYTRNCYMIQTIYLWESNYYDMNGFLMLYSVQSETYEPGSDKNLSAEYTQMILDDMVKKGLIQKQVRVLKAF